MRLTAYEKRMLFWLGVTAAAVIDVEYRHRNISLLKHFRRLPPSQVSRRRGASFPTRKIAENAQQNHSLATMLPQLGLRW